MSGAAEYNAWRGMLSRCSNRNDAYYRDYGGRGICVCDRWTESFRNFVNDMGPRPSARHSIDRIDNDGDYESVNCRWATKKEQSRNTRRNRLLSYDGKTQCLAAWAEEIGLGFTTIHARLKRGWTVEQALTRPPQSR